MIRTPAKFLAVLCTLLATTAHPQNRAPATASITGVLKGASGAIVAIHLQPVADNPVRYYDGYEALPQPDGSFSFTEIPPGHYKITVEDDSHLSPSYPVAGNYRGRQSTLGFTPVFPSDMPSGAVHLHAAEHRKGVVIQLTHQLSICGHVTGDIALRDQWRRDIGPPVIGPIDTFILYYRYNPQFHILENEGRFGTGKDGSFRITDLAPGTYFVKAGAEPGSWFPGSNNFAMAKTVTVTGTPTTDCTTDIHVVDYNGSNAALTSISVEGENKGEQQRAALLEENPAGVTFLQVGATAYLDKPISPGGTLDGIYAAAGTYEAVLFDAAHMDSHVWADAPTQKVIFDSQTVTLKPNLDKASPDRIVFRPHPMASIHGEVHLENVTRADFCPGCQSVFVSILREGNGEFQTVDLSKENHFDFHNVTPGDYQLFVYTTRPDKVFLKSIAAAGRLSESRRFSVPSATFVPMTVTLSGNLAQAAGHISPDARHGEHWQTEGMRPRATVSGKVLGDPGAIYTVRLLPAVYVNAPDKFLATQTAPDGSFHFANVLPGAYLLRAHDKTYVRVDYGASASEQRGTPLLIAPGANLRGLTLHAPHRSSICGHIISANADSRQGLRVIYRTASQQSGVENPEVTTDNDGFFRIDNLLPGDYFLAVMPRAAGDFLFPITADGQPSHFRPFTIEDGKDLGCGSSSPLEVHIPPGNGYFSVSASVSGDLPARVGDRFYAELKPEQEPNPFWPQNRNVRVGDDHHFHFDNTPPGQYRIDVYGYYGPEPSPTAFSSGPYFEPLRHLVASQTFTVVDRNLAGVTLTPIASPAVNGTVSIPTIDPPYSYLKPGDLTIVLTPHTRNGNSIAVLQDDGNGRATFKLAAIDPGDYDVRLQGTHGSDINSALYLQSLTLNGRSVPSRVIHIAEGVPADLHIELGSQMSSFRAHVAPQAAHNNAAAAPPAPLAERCSAAAYQVLLFSASAAPGDTAPQPVLHYHTASVMDPSCNGVQGWAPDAFNRDIDHLPPGSYYALAIQSGTQIGIGSQIDFGLRDDAFSQQQRKLWNELAKIATPLTLSPGQHLDLTLEDKTLEALRIASQLRLADEYEDLRPPNAQSCCSR